MNINRPIFIILLTLSTFIPRFMWVFLVDTAVVSDFYLFHNYAVNAGKGLFTAYDITYTIFPFKVGYPLLLSLFYRLFGTDLLIAKLLNVITSVCLAILVYWIGRLSFGENAGRIAGMLFSFWPSQIMYNSVAASEHIFTVFFVLSLGLFIKMVTCLSHGKVSTKIYILSLSAGISLALAHFIRPFSTIAFPAIVIYLFIFVKVKNNFKENILQNVKLLMPTLLGFIVCFSLISISLLNVVKLPIWTSPIGFNLLVGTNYNSSGMYNAEDEKIIAIPFLMIIAGYGIRQAVTMRMGTPTISDT